MYRVIDVRRYPPIGIEMIAGLNILRATVNIVLPKDGGRMIAWPDGEIYVGIDPGPRNMGMAFLTGTTSEIWEIEIPKAESRFGQAQLVHRSVGVITNISAAGKNRLWTTDGTVTIEGAAYGRPYGQVYLAEARIASALSIHAALGVVANVYIVPPKTVRAAIFGYGRKTEREWNELEDLPNAASALACALYSYHTR